MKQGKKCSPKRTYPREFFTHTGRNDVPTFLDLSNRQTTDAKLRVSSLVQLPLLFSHFKFKTNQNSFHFQFKINQSSLGQVLSKNISISIEKWRSYRWTNPKKPLQWITSSLTGMTRQALYNCKDHKLLSKKSSSCHSDSAITAGLRETKAVSLGVNTKSRIFKGFLEHQERFSYCLRASSKMLQLCI